jgi:thioredoxin-like negative regulator of GroEL
VIVFGDLSHEGVRSTMSDVVATAADPRHAGDPIVTVLVISHNETPDKLKAEIAAGGFPSLILYDQDRSAFGAYRILVMPTVVVVDPHGKVVSSMSGPVQQFKEKLSAALLLCAGRLSDEQFQHVISPETPTATAPAEVRADRLIHLGNELVRHGLFETAETRFKEAIDIAPGNVQAKLGLAGVMLRTGRIDEAEAVYQVVATADKGSVDAAIGLATVQTLRGGENLDKADLAASELVAKYPSNPKARFLMGLIYERKGNCTAAVAEFKRAAELLIGN